MKHTIIKTENFEILDSGVVIFPSSNEAITLSLIEKDGTPINIKILLNYNETIEHPNITHSLQDKDTIQFIINQKYAFMNFGFLSPQNIGTYNDRELFLNFRIDSNGKEDAAILKFTWYLK